MADSPPKPKTKTVTDWINRPYAEYTKAETRRTELWQALSAYIHRNGGWITSPPGAKYIRVEILQDSPIPAKLTELGYEIRHAGTGTRLTPTGTAETFIERGKQTVTAFHFFSFLQHTQLASQFHGVDVRY